MEPGEFHQVVNSRSLLFVPGDRSDRFDKAAASGADLVICDLEDAVAPDAKALAREQVGDWLSRGHLACVRINSLESRWYEQDCAALLGIKGLLAVMVPKAESAEKIIALSEALGASTPIIALIETALGVHRALEIAQATGVARLAFGTIDFSLDIQADDSDSALLNARSSLVLASRVAGISAPIDGVTTQFDDPTSAGADATKARGLGFSGKLCIHPGQIAPVNSAFLPTPDQVRQAHRVISSLGAAGVGQMDGQMIDKPVIERARIILRQYEPFRRLDRQVEERF